MLYIVVQKYYVCYCFKTGFKVKYQENQLKDIQYKRLRLQYTIQMIITALLGLAVSFFFYTVDIHILVLNFFFAH